MPHLHSRPVIDRSQPMTKEQAIEWLHTMLRSANYADSTHSSYRLWISRFLDYCDVEDVRSLDLLDAQMFLVDYSSSHDIADSTYNSALSILISFFSIVLDKLIQPKQLGKRRIETIQRTPIFPDQAVLILRSAEDPRLKALISLAFSCGLRAIEIRHLKFKHILKASHRLIIKQSKGNKTRIVPYPPSTALALNQYFVACRPACSPEDYVFPDTKKPGVPLAASSIYSLFSEFLQEFDFYLPDHTFHALRHAFATGMAMKNVPLPTIQKLMGHTSAATTAKYIHVPEEIITSLPDLFIGDTYETIV